MLDESFESDDTANHNWFVAMLKPNALAIAQTHLDRQGFPNFAPMRLETRQRRNRHDTRPRPLFPGYIFVQFDPDSAAWRKINSTRGITRLVLNNPKHPRPLPWQFIAGMRSRCDESGVLEEIEEIAAGDRIRIIAGPFADFVSKVEHVDSDNRVRVLLSIMSQEINLNLPLHSVQKAE